MYSDARGVHTVPPGAQRFSAEVGADGGTITGRWEIAPDGRSWRTDFGLTYRRLT